jgi:predicted ATP-dependent endonuclease of OLD family
MISLISRLIIENYRSIKNLDTELRNLNAFVGPNSSGKSNILSAINIIIGDTYPSVRSFEKNDFYLRDESNPIRIEVRFSDPLVAYSQDIFGFRLEFNGDDLNFVAVDEDGVVLSYNSYSQKDIKITSQMKSQVSMMYLPLDRQAYQQIKPSQWTVYGKLLKHIELNIDNCNKKKFEDDINESFSKNINIYLGDIEEKIKGYVIEQTGLNVRLGLSIIDPTMVLRDLRPRTSHTSGFEIDIENEGAGMQSSVAIAIARTYADIVKKPLVLGIEEPELFLHPHGCRHFYKILKNLSLNGVQIMYTTHERCFINVADYESVCLVKKENDATRVHLGRGNISDIDIIKFASKFDEELNEVFFAEKVVLVEGPDDKIACTIALERLGADLNKNNISIIECNGNAGIIPMSEILKKFNIELFALMDEDPGNSNTLSRIVRAKSIIGPERLFLQSPDLEGIFNQKEKFTKEKALRILPVWFSNYDVPNVYFSLKTALRI